MVGFFYVQRIPVTLGSGGIKGATFKYNIVALLIFLEDPVEFDSRFYVNKMWITFSCL